MPHRSRLLLAFATLALAATIGEPPPRAAAAPYQRRWGAFPGGGGIPSTGGAYRLGGTIGQPIARTTVAGGYRLIAGFWTLRAGSGYVGVTPDPVSMATAFRVVGAAPNPTRGATTIAFELPQPRDVAVRILDVQGRSVRTFEPLLRAAGPQRLAWDGRDDAGASLPHGLYFAHVIAGADQGVTRIVLLTEGGAR